MKHYIWIEDELFEITFEFKWNHREPLRDPQQVTFAMLNRFWSLTKNPLTLRFSSQFFLFWRVHPLTQPHVHNGQNLQNMTSFLSIFPKMPSETFFFQKFIGKIWQILWSSFQNIFQEQFFDTSISNNLYIEFLEIFLYRFYMFNLYNFIFERLIWKMISVYFLWFDYWTLKEWKTAKIKNHSVAAY